MAFNLPSPLFTGAKSGSTYSRPSDWPVITDTDKEVQFLFADIGTSTISILTQNNNATHSNIIIDWGDSTSDTVSGVTTTTTHQYTKGTGTACSRGYTTFKIRVYLQTPSSDPDNWIRECKPINPTTQSSLYYTTGILEAIYGDGTVLYGIQLYFASNSATSATSNFGMLEYVKLPRVMDAPTMTGAFEFCQQLRKVDMPITDSLATGSFSQWSRCFQNCVNLLEVIFPSNTVLVSLFGTSQTFNGCVALKKVVLPTNNISPHLTTTMQSCFANLYNLESITIPLMPSCTEYTTCFSNCFSLTTVVFNGLTTVAGTVVFNNMFINCYRLEYVSFPANVSSTPSYSINSMFSNCMGLKNITFPAGFVIQQMSSTFDACRSLQSADLSCGGTLNGALAGSMASLFNNCHNLTSFSLPILTGSSAPVATSIFTGCYNLETIIFDASYSRMLSFSIGGNTHSLKTLVLPSLMNASPFFSITTCNTLKNLTLPTSMSTCTQFTIQNCPQITEITLPTLPTTITVLNLSSMASLTTVSNMPTTVSITSFTNMFINDYSLKSIILPTNAPAAVTTWSSAFSACFSLESIVFPVTQNTYSAAQTMLGIFQNCASLKSITNFEKAQTNNATILIGFDSNTGMMNLPGLTFSGRVSKLNISGGAVNRNKITSLRHTNTTTGQWTGSTPQINISYTDITYANLVTYFNDVAATGTYSAKTINITGCAGAASLTAADRLILTSRGWTITG